MTAAINKYPGKCCHCGQPVAPYEGTLVRERGQFVPAHKMCARADEEMPDPIDALYEDQCREACGR